MGKSREMFAMVLAVCVALSFIGCKSNADDDGDKQNWNASAEISYPVFEGGKVIRNQVAGTSGAMIYYEYLTFSGDGTGGDYALYSFVKQNDATDKGIEVWKKLEENPFAEEEADKTLPKTFRYTAASGTLSVTIGGSTIDTFLFDSGTNTYMAAEKASPAQGDDKTSLFRVWSTTDGTYTFKDGGVMSWAVGEKNGEGIYENDGGVISTSAGIPFCWTRLKDSGGNDLYYQAFAASRKVVDAVGKSAVPLDGGVTEFNAARLMFIRTR